MALNLPPGMGLHWGQCRAWDRYCFTQIHFEITEFAWEKPLCGCNVKMLVFTQAVINYLQNQNIPSWIITSVELFRREDYV